MSKYQTRDLSGSLFKNENKKTDNHPDYSGEALIDGQAYFMDAWLKTADSGRRWMSFSFKPKQRQEQQERPAPRPAPRQPKSDFDEDPPF